MSKLNLKNKFNNTDIKKLLFFLMLMLLVMPWLQVKLNLFKVRPLHGAITEPTKCNFALNDWFSGTYQEQNEKYLNEKFGFRNLFVRINNQVAFSLFHKAKANGVVIGKHNYLYEENYIKAYYGTDYLGHDSIEHRMQRVKFLQDTLSKLDKNLILVYAAGKGSFYPEYFPEEYKTEKTTTNYETHVQLSEQLGISHIDFNDYFLKQKDTSRYPLYPQYGIHWSYYCAALAADSIIRYIENIRDIDMPNLYWDNFEMTQPYETDYDVADGMNILFKLRSFDMAYPHIVFQSDSAKTKPSVLVVSDSFFWGMFNFGIPKAFSNTHFWFYNKQIYPDSYESPLETSQINLMEQILNHDVIIIMATEATLPNFGWGFIENAYGLFKSAM